MEQKTEEKFEETVVTKVSQLLIILPFSTLSLSFTFYTTNYFKHTHNHSPKMKTKRRRSLALIVKSLSSMTRKTSPLTRRRRTRNLKSRRTKINKPKRSIKRKRKLGKIAMNLYSKTTRISPLIRKSPTPSPRRTRRRLRTLKLTQRVLQIKPRKIR